jgi:hypothetical protein
MPPERAKTDARTGAGTCAGNMANPAAFLRDLQTGVYYDRYLLAAGDVRVRVAWRAA